MLTTQIQERFENALTNRTLSKLVSELCSEGLSQVAIYYLFDLYSQKLQQENREQDEEMVFCIMDCIVGWCNPSNKFFNHRLTDEEIEEYKKSISLPEGR